MKNSSSTLTVERAHAPHDTGIDRTGAGRLARRFLFRPLPSTHTMVTGLIALLAAALTLLLLWLTGMPVGSDTITFALLLAPLTFYLSVIWHELGHLLAGILVSYRFVALNIGPLRLTRAGRGLRWSYRPEQWRLLGGATHSTPTQLAHFDTRRLIFIAGGPLATLLQLLLVLTLPHAFATTGANNPVWLAPLFAWLTFAAVLLALFSLFPLAQLGSDGAQLLWLWRHPPTARQNTLTMLRAASVAGQRPRANNPAWVASVTQEQDNTWEELFANLLAYFHKLDGGYVEEASVFLNRSLAIHRHLSGRKWEVCLLEAAYFAARYQNDATAARTWLARFQRRAGQRPLTGETAYAFLRARAALLLLEGNAAAAMQSIQRSLSLLPGVADLGQAKMERAWLHDLAVEAGQNRRRGAARNESPQTHV